MPAFVRALVALTVVLSLGACAYDRPCPPGTHLGPWGRACHPNR